MIVQTSEENKTNEIGEIYSKNDEEQQEEILSISSPEMEKKKRPRKYLTKHMKLYPELYRSDVSIHPSYTGLKNFPY
ncbi:uncharacterized protein LOC143175137 [Nomia melanderi]|uniref:uncharacterized protein LOC143175137 n=1 Tax=Nomia melanderi TaxID=2448451 RepID=UPI003FCD8BD7